MRFAMMSAVFVLGCSTTATLVPSHPAVARYPAPVEGTREAVREAFAERWLRVSEVGTNGFASEECRTSTGDVCPKGRTAWTRPGEGGSVDTYGLQVVAMVMPTAAGSVVRIGAKLVSSDKAKVFELGKGDVPAWLQHEIDDVQLAVSHKLASPSAGLPH